MSRSVRVALREYQLAQSQQYLDIGDANFVCDFQLNLELTAEHVAARHIIFPPAIKLLKGPAVNLFHQNDMEAIYGNLATLWSQNTNDTDSFDQIKQIQLKKSCHTKLLILFCLAVICIFLLLSLSNLNYDGFVVFLAIIIFVILLILYIVWYYFYYYPGKINMVRSIWRTQFLESLVEYIDDLQLNYNINNNNVRDFRFVILYPVTKSFGQLLGKQWLFVRVTNGESNHDQYNLFHVAVAEYIEGDGEDGNEDNDNDGFEVQQKEGADVDTDIKDKDVIVSSLGTPLLND